MDILDLSEVAWTCWGCFYTQQWAGAEDDEGIRPAAGTGNESEEKKEEFKKQPQDLKYVLTARFFHRNYNEFIVLHIGV